MELKGIASQFLYMNECEQCQIAKNDGVEVFIIHLTSAHSIPTEWPSERASRLTGIEAQKPYTTVAATRKKRRKLTTPRPLNSFMIFAQHIRRNVLASFDAASSSNVSRLLGEAWNSISKDVRAAYDEEATRLSKVHNIEFPTYKYQPKPRQWQSSSVVLPVSPATNPLHQSLVTQTRPPSPATLTISIPSTVASNDRALSPSKIKLEPPSPPLLPPLSPPTASFTFKPTPLTRSKALIRNICSTSVRSRTYHTISKLVKIAPAAPTPNAPPITTTTSDPLSCLNKHSGVSVSSCLSTSPSLSRTSSPSQQLTPVQENITPSTDSQLPQKYSVGIEAQHEFASNLAALHKLINQAATTSQQLQQPIAHGNSKPCILLTPIQSDIGQQAIISCGQSSTMPTLLTCGNTIYVALTVLQSPLEPTSGTRIPLNQGQVMLENQMLETSAESHLSSDIVDLVRSLHTGQSRPITDSPLDELLRVAAIAAATTTSQ